MLQTKSVNNYSSANAQTIGEKIVSVLRYPLFTIPLPSEKQVKQTDKNKITQPVIKKPVERRKTVKRKQPHRVPVMVPQKPMMPKNTLNRNNSITKIFTPNLNKEEFEKILFVLRACEKNSGKEFSNVLHVERTKTGSLLITTDGKRMHVAEIGTKIKTGNYKPVVTQDTVTLGNPVPNVKFPDWQKAVPNNVLRCGCINLENASNGNLNRINASFTKMSGERLNPNYLADLTKKPWVIYRQDQNHRALLLKELGAKRETYAVMMPLAA